MAGTFVLAIIVAVAAGVMTMLARGLSKRADTLEANNVSTGEEARAAANNVRLATRVAWVILAAVLILSCLTIVGTKKVGVVTSFGSPQGTLDNGLHLKFPWEKVTEFDAAIQTDTTATTVRLANQSKATVDNSIRWRIVPEAADELYRDYRDFDNVRDSLVTRQLNAALNEVFATYDPLASMDTVGDPTQGVIVDSLGEEVQTQLSDKIDEEIEVLDVLTPRADFDEATEEKISQYQQAIADTRIAKQRQKTAAAEASANRKLADSVDNDPNVLVSKCIDTLNAIVKAGQTIPAGFTCWPGGGSGVVIPASK